MNTKQTEALKLALEDLLLVWKDRPSITAIRKALAEQPAQRCSLCNYQHGHAIGCKNNPVDIALNKMAQNARELGLDYESSAGTQVSKVWWDGDKLMAEPISESEVYKPEPVTEWLTCPKCSHKSPYTPIKAKTLAEDAERITKQARAALAQMQPAQQQEPVAYASDVEFDDETEIIPAEQKGKLGTAGLRIPLYIKPPASKPWVGLTDDEIDECYYWKDRQWTTDELVRHVEAKLREKNT